MLKVHITVIFCLFMAWSFGQAGLNFSIHNNGHSTPVRAILHDLNRGEIITISEGKTLLFWDDETFDLKETVHLNHIISPYSLNDGCFSVDSNFLYLSGKGDSSSTNLLIFNLNSGRIQMQERISTPSIISVKTSSNGKVYALAKTALYECSLTTTHSIEHSKKINLPFQAQVFELDNEGHAFFGSREYNGIKSIDLNQNITKFRHFPKAYAPIQALVWNDNRKELYSGGYDHQVSAYSSNGKFLRKVATTTGPISAMALSKEGNNLTIGEESSGNCYYISTLENSIVSRSQTLNNSIFSTAIIELENKTFGLYSGGSNHEIDAINPGSGKITKRLGGGSSTIQHLLFENDLLYFSREKSNQYTDYLDFKVFKIKKERSAKPGLDQEKITYTDTKIKIEDRSYSYNSHWGRPLCYYITDSMLFVGTDNNLIRTPIKKDNWKVYSPHLRGIRAITTAQLNNNTYLITSGEDEKIHFWKADESSFTTPFASLYINYDNEYVLWNELGYFQSSDDGAQHVGFQPKGGKHKFSTLNEFFDVLYKPEEIAEMLNTGNSIENILISRNQRVVDLSDIKGASYVRLNDLYCEKEIDGKPVIVYPKPVERNYTTDQSTITLNLSAFDGGAGIKEINVLNNGKLVILDDEMPNTKTGQEIKKTYKIHLLPGDNNIEFYAINYQKRQSHKLNTVIHSTGQLTANSNLYAIVIGINKYKNASNNLNYAVADASALSEKLNNISKTIFGKTTIISIQNEQATRKNITKTFQEVAKQASPNDVFVFYFAGHGSINSTDPDAEYYLVPHEVTHLYAPEDVLDTIALSTSWLKKQLTNIPAQKQLILLDACHSGGAVGLLASRGGAEEKAIFQLARSSGIVLISASESEQFATEFVELGHGVFTYTLLLALDGAAEGSGGDQKITVGEIKNYMEDQVPVISQKHGGTPQYPTGFSSGQDFPIGIIQNRK